MRNKKISQVIAQIKEPSIAVLVMEVCAKHYDKLIKEPAACGNHHAYEGGLLDHLNSTAMLASKICDHYPDVKINRDVAVAGAFLHDIGKVECYEEIKDKNSKHKYKSTDASLLFHHIPIGYHLVRSVAESLNTKIKEKDLFGILHIIISHHGRKEYSSPRTPRTDEARIAAEADFIDAYINAEQCSKGIYGK
jgi:3'-5' exoribonuclease